MVMVREPTTGVPEGEELSDSGTCSEVLRRSERPIEVQYDASQKGLGATLMQEGRPIAYSSRALTDTEQRYA